MGNLVSLFKHENVGQNHSEILGRSRSQISRGTSRVTLRDGFSLRERRVLPGELSSPKFPDSHHLLEGSYSGRFQVFLLFGAPLGLSSHSGEDISKRILERDAFAYVARSK